MPGEEIDLPEMLAELHRRPGIRILPLEGGGTINGAFLRTGVVDEISLLLAPAIDGTSGGASIFEAGEGGMGRAGRLERRSANRVAAGAPHLRCRVVHD